MSGVSKLYRITSMTYLDSDESESTSINRTCANTIRKCRIHLDLILKTNLQLVNYQLNNRRFKCKFYWVSFNIANQPQDGTLPCGAVASLASPLSKLTISTKPQQLRLSNLPP